MLQLPDVLQGIQGPAWVVAGTTGAIGALKFVQMVRSLATANGRSQESPRQAEQRGRLMVLIENQTELLRDISRDAEARQRMYQEHARLLSALTTSVQDAHGKLDVVVQTVQRRR